MEEQELQAVFHLAESKGWEYLRKFIKSNIKSCDARLTGHGEEIKSLEELKGIQEKKKAFQEVLNFVNHRVEKLKNS